MQLTITSTDNKRIKTLVQLQEKSRNRRKSGEFVVEGFREINLALAADYSLETLYFCPELLDNEDLIHLKKHIREIIEVPLKVYQKIAYRATTEGVLAIGKQKEHHLSQLQFKTKTPLILVAEAPEKPGNIGALLRTADAANIDAVIIANPRTDLYNPNIIRSSVGCVFTTQIATGNSSEVITFLKNQQIGIYCAALQASKPYTDIDFQQASAIIVGTEADGLNQEWLDNSTQNIIIPMQGKIDSMNVSVSAGILIFEAKRQRDFSNRTL